MKIWLINHYAVPPQYYPLARQTNFAKYFMQAGHEVTIFAASTVHNSELNLITDGSKYREDYVNGVHYVYIKCRSYQGNGIKRIINMQEFADKLPGVCRHFGKPDAIVATSMPPMSCASGIRLARKYGCVGIAEIADLWPESLIAYGIAGKNNPAVLFLRMLEKWIYKKADHIIFTMEGAYDYIIEQRWDKEIPEEKVSYINNGVDLELFNENKGKYRIRDDDLSRKDTFKVVYTGSIRRVNNLGLLLDAAKKVSKPDVKFLIWGGGDEAEDLKKRVVEEKIRNVKFKGYVEKKYIPYIVSEADINIAHNTPTPLFRFGISFNKLFDYMAAGKPIVSDFPCKYNPSVITGCGKGIDEPTPENIAHTIEDFYQMDKNQYQQYCSNALLAAQEYDLRYLSEKLIAVIENELAK